MESSGDSPYHTGPYYGSVPSGCYMDSASHTKDTGRGGTWIMWTDLFNCKHVVNFASNPSSGQCTVIFPVAHGGEWNW